MIMIARCMMMRTMWIMRRQFSIPLFMLPKTEIREHAQISRLDAQRRILRVTAAISIILRYTSLQKGILRALITGTSTL